MINPWSAFWRDNAPAVLVTANGTLSNSIPGYVVVLSGSFNPLHDGHRRLADIASEITGKHCLFEISIANVDKPLLTDAEVARRIAQFANYRDVVITRGATFRSKSEVFRNTTFVVGFDTAERTLSTKYYRDEADMLESLRYVASRGNNIMVACRCLNGELKSFNDLVIPDEFKSLFKEISAEKFRIDISSTELRKQNNE